MTRMAKPKKKKPAKKTTKRRAAKRKPAKRKAKKATKGKKCTVATVCGKRRRICFDTKTIRGVKRRVIVSNRPA
jgi:hypothetical protein